MDFTREPIIETVITPKEGCKIVVRSSKNQGQEEHFVDAVEVVSFGHSFFFRSLERPKTFLVPATDYEILEVREARMVLKNVGIDRTIKIAGGKEGHMRAPREQQGDRRDTQADTRGEAKEESEERSEEAVSEKTNETKIDKKRDRRRSSRRRRGRESEGEGVLEEGKERVLAASMQGEESPLGQQVATTSLLTSLLSPPPLLISDTIAHYKDKFKEAFYSKEEVKEVSPAISLNQPEYGSFELSEEEEEEIYQRRRKDLEKHESPDQVVPYGDDGIHGESLNVPQQDPPQHA